MFISIISGIKRYKILFFLLFLIILLLIAIFVLNITPTKQNVSLIGYFELKEKITSTINEDFKDQPLSSRLINQLNILESKKSTDKEKYIALSTTVSFLSNIYRITNNNKYFKLINNDMNLFAKKNFPKYYDGDEFIAQCMDKSCADTNQPAQLNDIIEKINESDFPTDVKESLITDLTNTGYRSKDQKNGTVGIYWTLASMTKSNTWFSSSGANLKIADDIFNLIEKNYPNEYKIFIKAENEIKQ